MLKLSATLAAATALTLAIRRRKQTRPAAPAKQLPLFWTRTVDLTMHEENRQKLVARMSGAAGDVAVLQGGATPTSYCSDREPLFRQESYFQYLFGVREPDCFGAVDLASGASYLFVPRYGLEYEIWCGKVRPNSYWREHYGVTEVFFTDEIADVLQAKGACKLFRLKGLNTDSGRETQTTAEFDGVDRFELDDDALHPELCECRVIKTDREVDLMRYVTRISSAAHVQAMRQAVPGMFEYQMESIFRHECYFRGGARNQAYTCICGTGANGATLHYGHAGAPNDAQMADGDMMLLDMGSEFHCYACDVTCTWPVNGAFTADQRTIYEAVLASHDAVFEATRPGVEMVDLHRLSHRVLAQKLLDAGLLVADSVDELVDNHVTAVFYPHGLGHLLGLDTHDVGGYPKGAERIDEPGTRCLRMMRPLEAGMTFTVEPGCYFIDRLLDDALADPQRARFFNQEALARFRGFGGVRIESDVLVTETGMENLTQVPRTVEDIERVMAGGEWAVDGLEGSR